MVLRLFAFLYLGLLTNSVFGDTDPTVEVVNSEEADGVRPPLYSFVERNLTNDARRLLDQGRDPNIMVTVDGCRSPLLHLAISREQGYVVEQLASFGADLYGVDCNNQTALELAILTNKSATIPYLVKAGYNLNINPKISKRENPLISSLRSGFYEAASELIKNGVDLEYQFPDSDSYLHKAARSGALGNVDLFLGAGMNIDIMNDKGETPLYIAVETKNMALLNSLLNRGAKTNIQFNNSDSYLHLAVRSKNTPAIGPLLMHLAPIDAINKDKQAALHVACQMGSTEAVKILASSGANLDLEDDFVHKPLQVATYFNNYGAAEALLDAGDDINRRSSHDFTPLHEAAWTGHTDMARLLIDRGAGVNLKAWKNTATPVCVAIKRNHPDTEKYIRSRGGGT